MQAIKPDGTADIAYADGENRYWVLRSYQGHGIVTRYGGGELLDSSSHIPVFNLIVADGHGQLTSGTSYSQPNNVDYLSNPSRSKYAVFNVPALLSSPAVCSVVTREILQDIQTTTIRVVARGKHS